MSNIITKIISKIDPEIVKKIKKSAIISISGFLITSIPLIIAATVTALSSLPYWWAGIIVSALTASGSFLVVLVQQWKANSELITGRNK